VETERIQRRQRLFTLAENLAQLRNRPSKPPRVSEPSPAPAPPPGVLLNSALDTAWAHGAPGLSHLIHVFHQQWHGIRAAAGYSPGRKLAITVERPLSTKELRQAVECCAQASSPVILLHGFSENAHAFILAARKALKRSVRILAVWHGSTAQFHYDFEQESFASLMELCAQGIIDRVACVKPDMHLVSSHIFPKTLLNLPPRVDPGMFRPLDLRTSAALIPTPNDWRKNFHTNLYACMAASHIRQVYVTAQFEEHKGLALTKPVHRLKSLGRSALFERMRKVDVVLNASLSECQPMTALEALALRVPCITGPLGLGPLDEHPYQQLTQIARVDSVGAVRDAIERVLELQQRSPQQLREMMGSFESLLRTEALHRYEEFIHS
jgi:glycosyltransferase involved in cell wall biosynthesis